MTKYDYGEENWKQKQVKWQSPQIWIHEGYKFYMYNSSNGFLNWRCLKAYRPDGSPFEMSVPYKKNIGSSAKGAKEYLLSQINWDKLPPEEKRKILSEERLLF